MHISDGILSAPVAIGGYVLSAAIIAITTKKMDKEEIPKLSIMTAGFFAASLIHIPIPPISVHLVLSGLVGIIAGKYSFVSIFTGLILQAIMFQHGGIASLGVNAVNMGVPALMAGLIFHSMKKRFKEKKFLISLTGAVLSGIAIIISAVLVSIELLLTGLNFKALITGVLIVHIFVAIIEGLITFIIVSSLIKIKPEIIRLSST
jgi:cobalt/nickel transport system permease protein